ncbi:MAG: hypothetical protein ACO1OB_25830 [Archangium sp.]
MKTTPKRKNGVAVVEFAESLVDVGDLEGGIVVIGRNESGERVEVTLTPKEFDVVSSGRATCEVVSRLSP